MTVCIAAISENNKIIAVTDKMITIAGPEMTTTFEVSDSNKVSQLTDKVLALWSGVATQANEILQRARDKIEKSTETLSVLDIANIVKEAYADYWDYTASNFLQMKYKVDLKTFMTNQSAFDSDLVKKINEILNGVIIDPSILVAGIDNKPRIYLVDSANSVTDYTQFGYAIIGSGTPHANLSLIESDYDSSFEKAKALYALLEAKKRAQYDPSVGEYTDFAVIEGTFNKYDAALTSKIEKIFMKSKNKIKTEKKKYITEIKKIDGV